VLTLIPAAGLLADELTDVTPHPLGLSVWRQADIRGRLSRQRRTSSPMVVLAGRRLVVGKGWTCVIAEVRRAVVAVAGPTRESFGIHAEERCSGWVRALLC